MDRDLPEGVIDADPPGGWESGATADEETSERSRDAAGSPALAESGLPGDGSVEDDALTQGTDPDLSADEQED